MRNAAQPPSPPSLGAERVLELPSPGSRTPALTYALVFPNRYALGMANLGFQTVLGLVAGFDGAVCHRAFSDTGHTVEGARRLRDYDVVALSLCFEGDYVEALRLLAAGGVPLRADSRDGAAPLVVAGGVGVTLNPEPLAPFLDVVFLGEAEAGLEALHAFLLGHTGLSRPDLLAALADARLPGVYVPSRYRVEESGGLVALRTPLGAAPPRVERQWAPLPWSPARTRVLAPGDAFGGAYLLEVSRGCPHACRFCAAGYATRPTRFLALDDLLPFAEFGARTVGRLGFVGAAVSDHPGFRELARHALDEGARFTVSSFRAENLDEDLLSLLVRGGLKTLTVALEAGTDRLRGRLGKGISRDDALRAASLAGAHGLDGLRVYAMVGLPGETDDDVRELAALVCDVRGALGRGVVTLGVTPFVPKPGTPFQWEPMAPEATLKKRLKLLESQLGRRRGIRVAAEPPRGARFQGLLARGGRALAPLLERAAADGDWRSLVRSQPAADALDRPRDEGETLPWDFVAGGPSRQHLHRERLAAPTLGAPVPCRPGSCTACGLCPP